MASGWGGAACTRPIIRGVIRSLLLLSVLLISALHGADRSATAAAVAPGPGPGAAPRVAFIPVEGGIDEHRAGQFERALERALAAKPEFIVLKVTTDGGRLDSAMEMLRRELKAGSQGTKLVAFIDNRAYSAGALISYGCSRIYMTSDAYIGDIGVITINKDNQIEYLPEKIESPVRALLRQCAEHNGWDKAKIQKMTARNQELWEVTLEGKPTWVIEDDLPRFLADHPGLAVKDGKMLRGEATVGFVAAAKDRLLTYPAKEAVAAGMATALVKDLDEVYRNLGVEPSQVAGFEPSPQEKVAETLGGWAPLLAALAVLFLILEFKVPSGGLWLIGAGICGVSFLVMQYWLQLAGAPEVILIGLGLVAVILELFVLPTGGILGACGLLMVGSGLILAFMPDNLQFDPSAEGWGRALGSALVQSMLSLVIMTVGVVVAIVSLPRTRAMRILASPAAVEATSAGAVEASAASLVGRRLVARTELRPSGYVLVDGRDVAATAEHGVMVEAGAEVVVVESRFGELVVRPAGGAA